MTPNIYIALKKTRVFLGHHHPVIFISAICLLLALALLLLAGILTTTDVSSSSGSTIGSFDEKTANKIQSLHASSSTSTSVTLPPLRHSPFIE